MGPATFAPRCGQPVNPRTGPIPWEAETGSAVRQRARSRRRDAARVHAGDHPAFPANRPGQQPPEPGRPRPRSGRPDSGDSAATRQLDLDRMEVTPSCREHQPEHPTEVSRALQPRRHRRERAERGGQGTNPGRVRDRNAARENLTELARGQAGHDPVHFLGGRTEGHARRRTRNGSRPCGVAGVRRGRVPGTAGRCAAARRQHDHSADGDHGQHPTVRPRPAPRSACQPHLPACYDAPSQPSFSVTLLPRVRALRPRPALPPQARRQ